MGDLRGTDRRPIDFIVQTTEPVLETETPMGRVTLAPYAPGDETSILECFSVVFDAERSVEQWNWQYRDNPHGMHIWLGKLDDGTVVSQFCGLPVRAKVGDEVFTFAQIIDSMVHPGCRAGLKKRGVFGLNLLAYAYHFGGRDGELIQYGVPNPVHYRLGVQTLYYIPLQRSHVLTKKVKPEPTMDPLPGEIRALRQKFQVNLAETFSPEYDALCQVVRDRHEIIVMRDAGYLNWRYVENPNWQYDIVELRTLEGDLVGSAVIRSNWIEEPGTMIAEWLVDTEVVGAEVALMKAVEHRARYDGMEKVLIYLNPMAPEGRIFEDADYTLEPTRFRLVGHSYDPATLTENHLNRHWYYTMGDFDVV